MADDKTEKTEKKPKAQAPPAAKSAAETGAAEAKPAKGDKAAKGDKPAKGDKVAKSDKAGKGGGRTAGVSYETAAHRLVEFWPLRQALRPAQNRRAATARRSSGRSSRRSRGQGPHCRPVPTA